jgi:hypothetical protein
MVALYDASGIMNRSTIETLTSLARRASDRAYGYRLTGDRDNAARWADVARGASETAAALEKAL